MKNGTNCTSDLLYEYLQYFDKLPVTLRQKVRTYSKIYPMKAWRLYTDTEINRMFLDLSIPL